MPESDKPFATESRLERLRHSIVLIVAMLTPPIYSLERMEAICRRLIAKSPKAWTPRLFLADIYRSYARNEAACVEYEELCKLGSLPLRDRVNFAEVLSKLKNFARVVEISEEVVAKHPKDKNTIWRLAMSFMEVEQYGRAATYFQRSITAGNSRFEDYWRLGFCLVKAGLLEDALKAYKRGLNANPESVGLKESIAWVESKLRPVSDVKLAPGSPIHGNGTLPQPPSW